VLSLLAKPMLVTLPILLLLIDYWPLQRLKKGAVPFLKLVLEKWPLFVLSLASGVVTIMAQHSGAAVQSLDQVPAGARLVNGVWALAAYLGQTFWPVGLAAYYPLRPLWWWEVLAAALVLAALTALVLGVVRRPAVTVGWLWFLVAIAPVIGILQVGGQSHADRYTYVPHLGLFVAIVWLAADLLDCGRVPRTVQATLAGGVLLVLAGATARQVRNWTDSPTLWRHTLAATEPHVNHVTVNNLGTALVRQAGEPDRTPDEKAELLREGRGYLERAVRLDPEHPAAHTNLGLLLLDLGENDEGRRQLLEAVRLDPHFARPHHGLGVLASRQGKSKEAEQELRAALELDPEASQTREVLATLLAGQGRLEEAVGEFERILQFAPGHYAAALALAKVRARQGRYDQAATGFTRAAQLRPDFAEPPFHLGTVELLRGRPAQAADVLARAVQLRPDQPIFLTHLAHALNEAGRSGDAHQLRDRATRLDPTWPDAAADEAWTLATRPEAHLRDGPRALLIARIVNEASAKPTPRQLDVLAAAQAETGAFAEAAATLRRALPAASAHLVAELGARLKLYEAGKPYHQPPAAASP
jgi:tetratricopeptide (TPR) repeat protein